MTKEIWEEQDSLTPDGEDDTLNNQGEDEGDDSLAKLKEIASNQRIRAEKAEKELKEFKSSPKEEPTQDNSSLSQADLIAVVRADVADEDIDDIRDYAKLKKISVKEALSSPVMRSLLSERKEERATATATATGNKRSGVKSATPEDLLRRAQAGDFPESDEDINKLVEARFRSRIKK